MSTGFDVWATEQELEEGLLTGTPHSIVLLEKNLGTGEWLSVWRNEAF